MPVDAPPPLVSPPARVAARRHWRDTRRLTLGLLAAWFSVGFVVTWFARDLDGDFAGWPFSFWVAAQGGGIAFLLILVAYAFAMRRLDRRLHAELEAATTATGAAT